MAGCDRIRSKLVGTRATGMLCDTRWGCSASGPTNKKTHVRRVKKEIGTDESRERKRDREEETGAM